MNQNTDKKEKKTSFLSKLFTNKASCGCGCDSSQEVEPKQKESSCCGPVKNDKPDKSGKCC